MNYTLLNKNRPLAEIELSDSGFIVAVNKIIDAEAFPVGVITDNNLKNIIGRLNGWWQGRAIPASRDGLKQILQTYGIETTTKLAARSLGLSLSDQYWLKPAGSDIEWQDVNFFTNDFSSDLGDAFFSRGSSKPNINPLTPDASSNGWLKKKWTIIDGRRYLAKAGSVPLLQQPYNEVAASQIMQGLGIEHVEYKLLIEDGRPLSLCKNFVDTETEFVPANLIRSVLPKSKNDNEYTHFVKCAEKLEILNEQIVSLKDQIEQDEKKWKIQRKELMQKYEDEMKKMTEKHISTFREEYEKRDEMELKFAIVKRHQEFLESELWKAQHTRGYGKEQIFEGDTDMQTELRYVKLSLENMENSLSWKLTKPLRVIDGLIRRNGRNEK